MAERRRVLALLIVALLILFSLFAFVAWMPVRHARALWRDGKVEESIKMSEEWLRVRIWRRQYHQLLAVAHLSAGRRADANRHLRALRAGRTWLPVVSKPEVARRLFARGMYADFLIYDAASREARDSDQAKLYRAAAQLAVGSVHTAEATLQSAGTSPQRDMLRRALEDRRAGKVTYVFDRDGKPLTTFAVDRRYANERVETTLHAGIQAAAVRAMANHRGSLVAIDPRTNEVLAVAGDGIFKQHEPGSVVKVLTVLAALETGVDLARFFPYVCAGSLPIDGRNFGDWREEGHGSLHDLNEALAQSCNVVFADIGLRTGREQLRDFHKSAGFDTRVGLGIAEAELGKTVGEIFNNFETGFYAIGIEHETATTLHLAMLASMLANRGELTTPRILRARRSLVGDVIVGPPKQTTTRIARREHAQRVVEAMQAVVERPAGTARRAAVKGLELAAKTGTAGEEAQGYDALMIAFAPADQPKIAFALVAENAGPAEFASARIAHDFLTGLRAAGHL
jgi:membrane peptidoglycan carboxypeptidase